VDLVIIIILCTQWNATVCLISGLANNNYSRSPEKYFYCVLTWVHYNIKIIIICDNITIFWRRTVLDHSLTSCGNIEGATLCSILLFLILFFFFIYNIIGIWHYDVYAICILILNVPNVHNKGYNNAFDIHWWFDY